jgi:DNA polymerase
MAIPVTDPDALLELATLTAALRAHAELCALSGATGIERAAPDAGRDAVSAPRGDASALPGALAGASPNAPRRTSAPSPAPAAGIDAGSDPVTAEARNRLTLLAAEVAACTRCGLCRDRTQTVFARGTGSSGVCFVGEGPGADEDAQGFPFVGKAGLLLDRMIHAMGLGRDDVYVCNIVKCRPPKNRKPEPDEMAACRPYLVEQLELIQPKVIVALGATAVEGLLGISGGITRLRGSWRLYAGRIAVMPTFHPAYLLRTPEAKREVWQDLKEVMKHIGRPVPT